MISLQRGLGDAFTADIEEAWAVTYGLLAGTMKDTAAEPSNVTAVS